MKARIVLLAVFAGLWMGGLGARLWQLQVERHSDYAARAARQQEREVELEPPRGTIYDRRGRELAVSVEVQSAFAVPGSIADPTVAAQRLGRELGIDPEPLAERLRSDRDFVWVARKLDPPVAERLQELDIEGVHFLPESKRYYPMGSLAAQVVGFVGTDHRGLAGLEARFDSLVAGRPGRRTLLRDARRRTALYPGLASVAPEPGQDLHLTLDATIQMIVERELAAAVDQARATRGTAVVLDPASGEVLAMATYPTFDPNHFNRVPAERWRNAVVEEAYEPGSTFKLVTAAAVLERHLLTPDDVLDCELGGIDLGAVHINDHKPFGLLTVTEVIERSSNVGAIKLGLLVGEVGLHETIRALGFGEPTGIDLPGESPGIVRPVERWTPYSKAYISFGQEVSGTPLQLARAIAAIANGGRLLRPRVVTAVGPPGAARPLHQDSPVLGQAVTARTAAAVAAMARQVVVGGTGRAAGPPGYTAAGKTGTAQKVVDGRYSATRFVASFAGFAPYEHPRIVGVVTIDEPRGAYHGGQVAAPVFAAIAQPILLYLGVRPSRPDGFGPWPEEAASSGSVALASLPPAAPGERGGDPEPPGESAEPEADLTVLPDLAGLSARQALVWASERGVELRLLGSGWVRRQQPEPGDPIASAAPLRLWLDGGGPS